MDPLTLALIMGGIGVGKSVLFDAPEAQKQREMEAIKTKYSPWTGQQGDIAGVKGANPLGEGLAYGTTGYGLGQQHQKYMLDRAMQEKLMSGNNSAANSVWASQQMTPQDDRMYDRQRMMQMQRSNYMEA